MVVLGISDHLNAGLRAAMEDEVGAMFDLREEQPVLAAGVLAFSCSEEKRGVRQPLLTAAHQIPRGQRVGELLHAITKVGLPANQV